jgi:hypothetical protein
MKAHSRIGASSYSRWGTCPGSVRLSKDMPNTSSKYAAEGTKAHELGEMVLLGKAYKIEDYDDEMLAAVTAYVEFIREESIGASHVGIEERFELTELHPELFGTADAVIYKDKTLKVIDYKHGQGLAVEIENNKQLQFYALGALMKLKLPCSHVEMVIVQPRAFHPDGPIRKWKIPVIDLLDFSAQLVDDALRTEDPNAPVIPGDHCHFCAAAPTCPALHETAIIAAQEEFSPRFSYDPAKLGDILSKIPAIEAWAKSVKEFAFHEAQAGRIPPGYKLVPKRANRKWRNEEDAESFLLLELGLSCIEARKDPQLKTPAQIETLLSKEDKKRLDEIVIKESSGDTLAPITDKRKTSKPAIETEFTKITE